MGMEKERSFLEDRCFFIHCSRAVQLHRASLFEIDECLEATIESSFHENECEAMKN
jgi:hypothetical protein